MCDQLGLFPAIFERLIFGTNQYDLIWNLENHHPEPLEDSRQTELGRILAAADKQLSRPFQAGVQNTREEVSPPPVRVDPRDGGVVRPFYLLCRKGSVNSGPDRA